MTKERPILFSTPMVEGIIEERKLMTRRTNGLEKINQCPDEYNIYVGDIDADDKGRHTQKFYKPGKFSTKASCPFGQKGDILWVRETWRNHGRPDITGKKYIYKADTKGSLRELIPWKPSIHMPKDACRIWLEITSVRVERLQDITEEDALREGIIDYEDGTYKNYFTQKGLRDQDDVECWMAKGSFQSLWCAINGLDSWKQNPWVWVVEFKVLSTTGKPESL